MVIVPPGATTLDAGTMSTRVPCALPAPVDNDINATMIDNANAAILRIIYRSSISGDANEESRGDRMQSFG